MNIDHLILASFLTVSPAVDDASLSQGEFDSFKQSETMCAALNIYHEARSQGTAGRLAVLSVTLNRVQDSRFPNTVCDVVKEGLYKPSWKTGLPVPVRNKCQFSWWCDGKDDIPKDHKTFNEIYDLTESIISGSIQVLDITDGATHYHADYIYPAWADTKTKTIEIQDHIFYRWEK